MDTEKPATKALMAAHLAYLMRDAELYEWKVGHVFHVIWLQQIEQG